MNVKHFFATGFVTIFSTAVAMAGCAVDSASDAEDAEDEAVSSEASAIAITSQCNSPWPQYGQAVSVSNSAANTTTIQHINNQNTVYDVSDYCTAAINARRRTVHKRSTSPTAPNIQPYYSLYYTGTAPAVVPAYSRIGIKVDATPATHAASACRLCKGLAEASVSGHAAYGACSGGWNFTTNAAVTGPTYNDNSVGSCGATVGGTAKQAVDNCLNLFENESGGGHKGPIWWDSERGISCVVGVYKNPTTGAVSAKIRFDYSWPKRVAAQPNGGNCKISGECLSGRCNGTTGRCEGFASSFKVGGTAITTGVSKCPLDHSRNCTQHPEDAGKTATAPYTLGAGVCVSKNLACASGTCQASGLCAKGVAGKPCVTNADCNSNVCSSTKTCT